MPLNQRVVNHYARGDLLEAILEGLDGPPPLGLHLTLGDSAKVKVANMVRNVEERRVAPWAFICR